MRYNRAVRTVRATRYVTPLREGGSLPAIVEADDSGTYVLKFRGAGQGIKALVAELVAGEIARSLGLPVPELVLMELDPLLARSEPDPEIQALIRASAGANLALDYLPGSLGFDPLLIPPPDTKLASEIVWFDAFVTNVDRTPRNPNLLLWHKQLYLIDHGAALYFHHGWDGNLTRAASPFAAIKQHVLLPLASKIAAADETLAPKLSGEIFTRILAEVPDEWLTDGAPREAYVAYFLQRLTAPRAFVEEAKRVHQELV